MPKAGTHPRSRNQPFNHQPNHHASCTELRANQLAEIADAVRARRIDAIQSSQIFAEKPRIPNEPKDYEANYQPARTGYYLPRERKVLDYWPGTPLDGRAFLNKSNGDPVEGYPLPTVEEKPFRVRYLRGALAGAVCQLSVTTHIVVRSQSAFGTFNPLAEPVPASEPLCPPAAPANMPSDFNKARSIVARVLKKDAQDATFEECAKHFRSKLPK